jgi:hypothetical protein
VPYPVTFEADYEERRSRLTTLFRWVLAIPHWVVLFFYSIAAGVVAIVAWFALLFTARYPQGMYDFVAGFLRYRTYVYAYSFLLTDKYPPFTGAPDVGYPVRLNIGPPQPEYNRLKVLFRFILAIPVLVILIAMQVVYEVGALLAWFAIIVLGRQPKGLQDMIVLGISYESRANAYFFLVTEDWPPFTDEAPRAVEAGPQFGAVGATPPAAERVAPHGDPLADEVTTWPPRPEQSSPPRDDEEPRA